MGLFYTGVNNFTTSPPNVNDGTPWWQNLLLATGQTFVNGLNQTLNQQNQQNPYAFMPTQQQGMGLLALGVIGLLIFKIL
jgi:hypothetical protein